MARKKTRQAPQPKHTEQKGITRITVANFKSIVGEQSIEIRPLTILAGANSSGKSSMMQPLLLLKQTLEAQYNPGALLLDGPNVKFSQAEQLLARGIDGPEANTFSVGLAEDEDYYIMTFLRKDEAGIFKVERTTHSYFKSSYCIDSGMAPQDLNKEVVSFLESLTSINIDLINNLKSSNSTNLHTEEFNKFSNILLKALSKLNENSEEFRKQGIYPFSLSQDRCFLDYCFANETRVVPPIPLKKHIIDDLHCMIHLPGLRGNPQRTYPLTPLGPNFTNFSGTFENYTASVINYWQRNKEEKKLKLLNRDLTHLALTNKIEAHQISGVHVELLVNRLFHSQDGIEDMVNIADVGVGVSQALPVVVALHAAEPGQFVYIEQPEIHLHPRAQAAMAEVLADAAIEGKRVVIETHSDLVLSGIQTLVAEGKLPPELVKLHWFEQLPDGSTKITSSDLDQAGAFGDWPEDFHKVILAAENRYLDAAEARLLGE